MLRFPAGGVLVTAQALPEWAPLLARATAMVTEQGGMAGHLASVAREFGLPALFDVHHAVKRLVPGETVTVDAGGRTVYRGLIRSLLEKEVAKQPPMAGSPIHHLLEQISRLVVPLNLTDTTSPPICPRTLPYPPRHHPVCPREISPRNVQFRQNPRLFRTLGQATRTTGFPCNGGS